MGYESWMFEESDLIQHAGKAFGERLMADRFALTLDTCDKDLKPILSKVFSLYLAAIGEKNLAWFVINGLVPSSETTTSRVTQLTCVQSSEPNHWQSVRVSASLTRCLVHQLPWIGSDSTHMTIRENL